MRRGRWVRVLRGWSRFPAASRMPPTLVVSVIRNVPTAVFAAVGPWLSASVAWVPVTVTVFTVAADGAAVNTNTLAGAVNGARVSLNVVRARSTLPSALSSNISADCRIGLAPSLGAVLPNDAWLPAASRMPAGSAASATVNEPTAVSSGPAPSVMVVGRGRGGHCDRRQRPPLGTSVSVHGAVPAE